MKDREWNEAIEAYRGTFGEYPIYRGGRAEVFVKALREAVETGEPLPDPDDAVPEDADASFAHSASLTRGPRRSDRR